MSEYTVTAMWSARDQHTDRINADSPEDARETAWAEWPDAASVTVHDD